MGPTWSTPPACRRPSFRWSSISRRTATNFPAWISPRLRSKTYFWNLPAGGSAIEKCLDVDQGPHAFGAAQPRFYFFQPDFPVDLSVSAGRLARAPQRRTQYRRYSLCARLRAGPHRNGQLLGIEHSTGYVPRTGHLAAFPGGARGCRSHARLQHSIQLHFDPAHRHH